MSELDRALWKQLCGMWTKGDYCIYDVSHRYISIRLCCCFLASLLSSSTGSAFAALCFWSKALSASWCCCSTGVSVQSNISESHTGAVTHPNCCSFNLVGLSTTKMDWYTVPLPKKDAIKKTCTTNQRDCLLVAGPASILHGWVSWIVSPLQCFYVSGPCILVILGHWMAPRTWWRGHVWIGVVDQCQHLSPSLSLSLDGHCVLVIHSKMQGQPLFSVGMANNVLRILERVLLMGQQLCEQWWVQGGAQAYSHSHLILQQ